MDNVTHSLAGLVLAESAVRLRARRTGTEPSARFRAIAAVSSLVAANLPDADLVYTGVGGDRLAYMLHHRGYTHTVLIALLGAALLWGGAWLVWRWRAGTAPAREDARWLAGLLLVSTLAHLVLDWTNSYGVHLFWPFDDRWAYGDAVFIVEPWFWVVAVPPLVAASARRVARGLLSLVLVVGLGLAWRVQLVTTGAAVALTLGAVLSIVLARRLRPGPRIAAAVAAWVAVTLVMAAGSAVARAATVRAVRAADPAATLVDVVVTPLPANPVCVRVITVERSGAAYRVATARVSSVPATVAASRCVARDGAGPAFRESSRPSTAAVQWDLEWAAPHAGLVGLARESCPALAALRFIRVPVWRAIDDSTVMLGDARYGGASGRGLGDVRVPRRSTACPEAVPPWTPPRADLL
ncbi:MAG TPA: metal-dependent hydrolase [Gemmatimonadaceae bacterium]|nr:metal-dependent hydrolase [Gemmatimonadaceae bacterium]